jgi:tetratricopeptide (TPR) repeat protein
MGLRPRTARRLALVASLLILLVGGAAAFYTIPKLQNARQLRNFERDGLLAHEEGRHHEAVQLLGRFLRAMRDEPVDPAVRLAFARSRADWEVGDGGHLPASIAVYREYLRENPEDRDAAQELLDLFVQTGAWTEARDLAVRLRPEEVSELGDEDLEVIRFERQARLALNTSDPLIPNIEDRLLASSSPKFGDAWAAYSRASASGDDERAMAVIERFSASDPDSLGARFLRVLHGVSDLESAERVPSFARAINLDPESGEWLVPTTFDDPDLVRLIVGVLELERRLDLALRVLEKADAGPESELGIAFARRLFWAGERDRLLERVSQVPHAVPAADLIGYASLVAIEREDADLLASLRSRLEQFEFDYRAQAWLRAIASVELLRDNVLVESRGKITEAIERYALEPTFRLILGNIHDRLGRSAEAMEAWAIAEQLAAPYPWVEPGSRKVALLLRTGRLLEAGESAWELAQSVRLGPAFELWVRTSAVLARSGLIDATQAELALGIARQIRDSVPEVQRESYSLMIATFEAALGRADAARSELLPILRASSDQTLMADAIAIDQAFGLGLTEGDRSVELPTTVENPEAALRSALLYVNARDDAREPRVAEALRMMATGVERATAADRAAWLRANAQLRDAVGHDSAEGAWRAAIEADPENIVLLTEAIESDALGYDAAFVQQTIDRIVELTATQGRTLPTRLRLARAKSIFGRQPNRQRRDEAISIVRSVVVAEPQNIAARTMLANMLQFPCPPTVTGADRFTPDLAGAVEQFVAAARMIPGFEAFGYLLRAAELQILAGNESQARQLLMDGFVRAQGNVAGQQRIARELGRLGDGQTASRLLTQLYQESQGTDRVDLGLQLAQIAIASNEPARARTILEDVTRASTLSADQLVQLALSLRKIGLVQEFDRILSQAETYGIDPREATLVRAQAAAGAGEGETAVALLQEVTAQNPEDSDAWEALIRLLVELGRGSEAAAQADRALEIFPDNVQFEYWKQIGLNDPAAAIKIMTARPGTDETLKLAIERVESYDRRRESLTPAERISELRELSTTFPNNSAVQKFALRERFELGDDPASLTETALAASRRFVGDEDLMRMAAEATYRAGRYSDSARIASDWRGRSRGSPLEPDLYIAQAAQRQGDHAAALARLEPYLEGAIRSPDEGENASVLRLHGRSALQTTPASVVRGRLEPIARQSERFRLAVWPELAASYVQQASDAADWLRSAEDMGLGGAEPRFAESWMTLAQRFPERGEEFAMNAVRLAGIATQGERESPATLELGARAHLLWAEFLTPPESTEAFAQAEVLYIRAAQLDPDNLGYRFQAAGAATRAGRPNQAERHYRMLIEDETAEGLLLAAARNNLAGLLSLVQPDPQRLQEGLALANEAVDFARARRDGVTDSARAAFLGTRGWVNLGLNRPGDAVADFQEAAKLDPESVEAWAGLSIARTASGADEGEAEQAMSEARAAAGSSPISQELRARLEAAGVEW